MGINKTTLSSLISLSLSAILNYKCAYKVGNSCDNAHICVHHTQFSINYKLYSQRSVSSCNSCNNCPIICIYYLLLATPAKPLLGMRSASEAMRGSHPCMFSLCSYNVLIIPIGNVLIPIGYRKALYI